MWHELGVWFSTHEWVAVWFEGIALVFILAIDTSEFIRQGKERREQHAETAAQLAIAKENAESARLNAQALINAERAWILAYLSYESVFTNTSTVGTERSDHTRVYLRLRVRNEGRSPAWVDDIYGSLQIIPKHGSDDLVEPENELIEAVKGPLAPGKEWEQGFNLTCPGELGNDEYLVIAIRIEYRDIFDHKRETVVAYSLDIQNRFQPMDTLYERMKNT